MDAKSSAQNSRNVGTVREEGATYEDYAKIPDDMGRFELLDGELLAMSPAPSTIHQFVSKEIQKRLYQCDDEYDIFNAPFDVILSPHSVLQPDIVMIHKSKRHQITLRGMEGVPDLVVEILSPSSIERDRVKKMRIYAHYGVPEYWIIDMGNQWLEQYVLDNTQYELCKVYMKEEPVKSDIIRCIGFTMAEIFADIPKLD